MLEAFRTRRRALTRVAFTAWGQLKTAGRAAQQLRQLARTACALARRIMEHTTPALKRMLRQGKAARVTA
eukprot:6269226-Lingulodinium_polyedra.AAC.1